MATRTAAMAVARSISNLSKTVAPKTVLTSRRTISPLSFRSIALSAFGGLDSLTPSHSVVASLRLRSVVGVDSASLSWLSQVKKIRPS